MASTVSFANLRAVSLQSGGAVMIEEGEDGGSIAWNIQKDLYGLLL